MKLAFKLTFAFLIVSLISIGLAAGFIWVRVSSEFNSFLAGQSQNDFALAASTYYQNTGSWSGVDTYLREQGLLPPLNETNPPPQPYVLVDVNRAVIVASDPYRVGEKVKMGEIEKGLPIKVNGVVVGTVIATGQPLVHKPIDQKYISQISQALWIAGLGGVFVALMLGLLIAHSLTNPLREIMKATREMAKGKIGQQVSVRSKDELGELARSFNQMNADLARASQLRRQMTADIAHDLRNPLTVISGYLESLEDGKLQPTPERFAVLQAEVRQLQHLVEDLRTLSLADAGELKLYFQQTSPLELLQHVADAYHDQAVRQNITLTMSAESSLPEIYVDPKRVEQALGNLLSNALRYTQENGEVQLTAKSKDGKLILSVRDNGSGISPEILPHIFERSYRGDSSRSGYESGLGLAIVKSLAELHHGNVIAESQHGLGSMFSIVLPINN